MAADFLRRAGDRQDGQIVDVLQFGIAAAAFPKRPQVVRSHGRCREEENRQQQTLAISRKRMHGLNALRGGHVRQPVGTRSTPRRGLNALSGRIYPSLPIFMDGRAKASAGIIPRRTVLETAGGGDRGAFPFLTAVGHLLHYNWFQHLGTRCKSVAVPQL